MPDGSRRVLLILCFFFSRLEAQSAEDGFLGLRTGIVSQSGNATDQVNVPLEVIGGSTDYEILTEIRLTPNLLRTGEAWRQRFSGLGEGQVEPFGYFSFAVDQQAASWRNLAFYLGYGIAHRGYALRADRIIDAHLYQLDFRAGSYWFLHKNWLLAATVTQPLPVFRQALAFSYEFYTSFEVRFDPTGPIRNPAPDSAFFSVGLDTNTMILSYTSGEIRQTIFSPYIKFTLLY